MIPGAFAYERAESLDQVLQFLKDGDTKVLAGGHSLLPLMKLRLVEPKRLVDISELQQLRGVKLDGNKLTVGALTTHAEVARHPLVRRHLPALAEAASHIGDLQVRNRGTVGGNLAHADPASDLPAIALAFDATLDVLTMDGQSQLDAESFFLGPLTTALPEGGIVLSVAFEPPPDGSRTTYLKYPHPASGYAVVGVAVALRVDDSGQVDHVRVAITGAGDVPYRALAVEQALQGQVFSSELINVAASRAADDGVMGGDLFASEEYRAHLCQVYTERALRSVL